jgi:hypothetical protein
MDAGIIPGSDMTPEAALTKLSYVIGKDISLEGKKKVYGTFTICSVLPPLWCCMKNYDHRHHLYILLLS